MHACAPPHYYSSPDHQNHHQPLADCMIDDCRGRVLILFQLRCLCIVCVIVVVVLMIVVLIITAAAAAFDFSVYTIAATKRDLISCSFL